MSLRPKKRSLNLRGHQTSVTLEDRFWDALCEIAKIKEFSINKLVAEIDETRDFDAGLASAIRDYVLRHYMDKN